MSKKAKFCKCKKKYSKDCNKYSCKFDYMESQGLGSLVDNGTSAISSSNAPRTTTTSRSGVES